MIYINNLIYNKKKDKHGKIEIIIGPMYAEKTTELKRRLNRFKYIYNPEEILCIGHTSDSVNETHNGNKKTEIRVENLMSLNVRKYKVIGIDEAQFFPDLIEFSTTYANKGKIIIVAGLDSDYEQKTFGQLCELIPKAEEVIKLKAVCVICKEEASFSFRIDNEIKQKSILGKSKYISVCRECYNCLKKEKKENMGKKWKKKENMENKQIKDSNSVIEKTFNYIDNRKTPYE